MHAKQSDCGFPLVALLDMSAGAELNFWLVSLCGYTVRDGSYYVINKVLMDPITGQRAGWSQAPARSSVIHFELGQIKADVPKMSHNFDDAMRLIDPERHHLLMMQYEGMWTAKLATGVQSALSHDGDQTHTSAALAICRAWLVWRSTQPADYKWSLTK